MKTALITGISGQDGSYLAELLLKKGYNVFGLLKKELGTKNIDHIIKDMNIIEGDLADFSSISTAIKKSAPEEVYNLAVYPVFSSTGVWANPVEMGNIGGIGTARVLEAIRQIDPKIKFFQASTSEIFGTPAESPQNENTTFNPSNPYSIAKLYAHLLTTNYRRNFGMFACCGILYNHESPRRGLDFVTRKITSTAAKIKNGTCNELILGNLDARRDWGFAGDYVEAMWLMLQQKQPEDFIIATGETHSVKEFVEEAFGLVGLDWEKFVKIDEKILKPESAKQIVGDITKIKSKLKWEPTVKFRELVRMMMESDMNSTNL